MKLIIVLALLQIAFCGHIYVSDPQLFYQNTGYISSAQLYFKLETLLEVGEVLKITWPYKFNYNSGSVVAKINKAGSTATPKALTTIATDLEYLIVMSEQLDAGQWYTLNLSTTDASLQSPPAQYYNTPIKMSTHSGYSQTSVDKYALYDYNNMCGFIAVASAPGKLKSVSVSTSATSTILPSQVDGSKDYEDSYFVYITILTTDDYDYGGIYYVSLIGGFTWQGDCTYFPQTCGVDETSCTPVKALTTKEYSCEALVGASQMKFVRFQNSTKYAINKNEPLKFKVKVKNPSKKDISPISVQLVSHYANFIYEYYSDSTTIFQTNLIVLNPYDTLYFWGLPQDEAASTGCPVRFYISVISGTPSADTDKAVWNKIWLPFAPNKTLPTSSKGFRLRAQIKPVTWINDVSIYTDAPNFNPASIHCYSVKGKLAADDSYIECLNIGVLQVNVTKYLRFSFMMTNSDYTAADAATLARFGEISIFFMDSDDKVTETRVPSKITTTSLLSQTYDKTNALLTKASDTTIANLIDAGNAAYRTSIIYPTSAKLDLVFLITTTYALQCGGTTAPCAAQPPARRLLNEEQSSHNRMLVDPPFVPASIIVKIIANPYAIKLSELDSSIPTASDVYKGVQVLPGITTDSTPGTFGASFHATELCHYIVVSPAADTPICSTNSAGYYISYADAQSTTTGKQYLYNQWFKHDNKYELHLVCYSGALQANICGGFQNGQATGISRGIVMKDVEFLLQANPLYPSQNELDFIMCIRYTASTTFKYTESTSLASSSLINAQIINLRSIIGINDASTFFKIGVLNYYADTDSNYNYVPTILRVGGYMQAADIKDNQGIAFFFDGAKIVINSQTLSPTFPLLPTECVSTISTDSTQCHYYPKNVMTATTAILSQHLDYYPGLNVITISGRIAEKTEFNYYIPVQIKASPFTTAFIGLLSNVQVPQPAIVFKLYGLQESKLTIDFEVASTQFDVTNLLATATDGENSLTTGNDWESVDATKYGKINTKTSADIVKTDSLCYSQSTTIYPESDAASPSIDASIGGTSGWADPFNDETGATGFASKMQFAGSVHFTVHSSVKFWSSPFTWSLTDKSKKPFSGACAEMTITSYKTATVNATSYLIVCPYEGTLTTGDKVTKSNIKINGFTSWKWPDYFGTDAPIGAYLRYLWTDKFGNLKAFIAEKSKGSARTECTTLNDLSQVYALSTNQKKTTFSITPLSSLTLLKATQDKSNMQIILTTAASSTNAPTTSKCSVELDNIKCSLTKNDKIYTFALTNINTQNPVTIQKTGIQINFWMSSSVSSESSTTYTAAINGYFYANYPEQKTPALLTLATCSTPATWGAGTAITRTISVDNFVTESTIANSRGYFSFKFSSSNDFLDESKFTIDLSFLSTAISVLVNNLRCLAYKNSVISHEFALFDVSTFSAINLEYRPKLANLARPSEFSNINYEFKCYGSQAPSTLSASSKIRVTNIIGSLTTADAYSADWSLTKTFTTLSTSAATVSMTKTFNYTGQEATYTFKVITKELTGSPSVIQFKAGSQLYVEFARDINPRFNKLGIIRCYQESEPTYCSYESERRIAFTVRTDLNHNKTEGYSFSIVGVNQPASLTTYSTMYVALVPYLGTLNTLLFQDNSTVTDTITTDSGTVSTLEVTQYEQSTTDIRSTFQFTMTIRFPINSVQDNVPIWVDLPEEFDEATFLGWTPSCKLQNVKEKYNDTITNYVTSCSLSSTRRIKIILSNATSYTAKKLFQLTVSSIPTYNYYQVQVNAPLVWFGDANNQFKPLYKTNLGNFNGTYNLASFTYSDQQKLITWDSTTVNCFIGIYKCSASLIPQNNGRFYLDLDQVTPSGQNSSYFSLNPSKVVVTTGKDESKFKIAPKASAAPGLYQLKWTHEAPTSYYVIPPLFIITLNTQIKPATKEATYEVPNKGRSLPIIFDFKDAMPETDVTITGQAESSTSTAALVEISPYVTFQSASQTLTYSETSVQTQVQFVVKADKGTSEVEQLTAKLTWSVSGTNSKSYSTPDSVTVTIVNPPEGTPELTLNTPDSNAVGTQTIVAKCSHAGVLYYVISQGQSLTQIEYTAIQAASEDKNIKQTDIETVYTNPSRTFYGYETVTIANSDNSFTISNKFQSQAKYYMRMYCVNLASAISEPKDVSWTQASNNGKPLITTMQFTSINATSVNTTTYVALNDTQRKEIACVICKETQIEKDRVYSTNGVACSETGAVSTVNTTTTNKTARILLAENATSEYFVVMPDLFSSDGSLDTVKTTLESTAFQTTLTSNTLLSGFKMQAISCSINSAYPATPYISSPSVSPSESSITFTWTGANNTDGFVFVGVVATTNGTVVPTELQLKKNSGYSFTGFNKAFYNKDKSVAVTVSSVTKCSDYSYYWVATNEDADTYQYSTGVKQGTTKTIGCPTSASMLAVKMLGLLVLFALLI